MRSWQERCADIIDFLENQFKETRYRMYFGRREGDWTITVEKVRHDGGPHTGDSINWLIVSGEDIDSLPDVMLAKANDAVLAWQKEGFEIVKKQLENWQRARAELDKRLNVNSEFDRLKTAVESKEDGKSDLPSV